MRAIYDLETYPNFFLCGIKPLKQAPIYFEYSTRKNELAELRDFLRHLLLMIGFNNLSFDYPVLHHILTVDLNFFEKVQRIFTDQSPNARFSHELRPREWLVPQMDLFRIHHFDNKAKRVSLKTLEFNMRSASIEDLPIAPGTWLTPEQMEIVKTYNGHDLSETEKFYERSADKIAMREAIGPHAMNYNDTKIGKRFLIGKLEEAHPGICYYSNGAPRQSRRDHGINLNEVIFPYIRFENPEFTSTVNDFKQWCILETKGGFCYSIGNEVFKKEEYTKQINGFLFHFGTGGIHGSVKDRKITKLSDETILDIDVTSFYPSISIANHLCPEHLGEAFYHIYAELKAKRLKHKKGSPQNAQLKYGLNGVYGDSNNEYSPFHDPKYTMAITINGQLLLCMLAEQLIKHSELLQINTDGMTIKFPSLKRPLIDAICKWWQRGTCLDLEFKEYSGMWIRDVNNYIAQGVDGKIKRKGAYEYRDLDWHKNHGGLIVPRAAEAAMVHSTNPIEFLKSWNDPFDFFELVKAPSNGRMETKEGAVLTKSTRFYVSINGVELIKVLPPLAKPGAVERRSSVIKGRKVTVCNRIGSDFRFENLDYDYYFQKVRKLMIY
jgi:hypothetical protein